MFRRFILSRAISHVVRVMGVATLIAGISAALAPSLQAQARRDRYRDESYRPLAQIDPWTYITVRTTRPIDARRSDGRVYTAVVDRDVWDDQSRLTIPAIPRGSPAELIVRTAPDGDLILDLASVTVRNQRYGVQTRAERIESRPRVDNGDHAAEFIGGGALIGTIVGAIAGGGKGAVAGAAAGAAAGTAALMTRGRAIRVPAGALLTFQLQHGLAIDVPDQGYRRGGLHYHRD